jgi:two-component system response regulator FixJ
MPDRLVHVVDDDDAVRDSLSFVLEMHNLAVRTYPSGEAFLEQVGSAAEGCLVTDVRMPGMSGLDLVRRLKDLASELPVIMITGHGDVPLAVEAMRAGVVDFLEKPFENEALLKSIDLALEVRAGRAQEGDQRRRFEQLLTGLSPRETDVLRGVIAGKMNKIIAHELGISIRTVEVYRANVMSKTNANSLSELVRMAMVAGF